jgi:hypothetical protein
MKLRSALWHEYAHAELSQRGLDTFLDEVEDRHTVGNLQVKGLRGGGDISREQPLGSTASTAHSTREPWGLFIRRCRVS